MNYKSVLFLCPVCKNEHSLKLHQKKKNLTLKWKIWHSCAIILTSIKIILTLTRLKSMPQKFEFIIWEEFCPKIILMLSPVKYYWPKTFLGPSQKCLFIVESSISINNAFHMKIFTINLKQKYGWYKSSKWAHFLRFVLALPASVIRSQETWHNFLTVTIQRLNRFSP